MVYDLSFAVTRKSLKNSSASHAVAGKYDGHYGFSIKHAPTSDDRQHPWCNEMLKVSHIMLQHAGDLVY